MRSSAETDGGARLIPGGHADPAQPDTTLKFLGQIPCGAFAAGAVVNGVTLKPSASTTACFPALDASQTTVQKVPVIVTKVPPAAGPLFGLTPDSKVQSSHFTVPDRKIGLKRESGVNPELPRSGKQERTLRDKHWFSYELGSWSK